MLCQRSSDYQGCFVCLFSFSLGVLAHLERLEAQRNRKSEEPTVREKESSLRTKICELQQQRERLRAEVKRRRARVSRKAMPALLGVQISYVHMLTLRAHSIDFKSLIHQIIRSVKRELRISTTNQAVVVRL